MSASPVAGTLLLAALSILWGSNWPAMKLALREIDPWTFRTICLVVGGGGLLGLVRVGGHSLRVPRAEWRPLAVIAFFNITGWHLCVAYGLTLIRAGRGAIIAYTMPLWTVLFGRLLLGEQFTASRLTALGLGLAGMAVLLAPDIGAIWTAPAGALLIVAAAMSWAIGTVLTKARRWPVPTGVLTGWQLVLGSVPIVVGTAVRWSMAGSATLEHLGGVSGAALLGTAYATFVGVIFCHWAWFRVVAILPAAVAAIGTLGVPIVGLLTSALVLGEPVGASEIVALILVLAGLGILMAGLARPGAESLPAPRPVSSLGRTQR